MRKERGNSCCKILPCIEFWKYRYRTPKKKLFQLQNIKKVSPVHLNPTQEMYIWFTDDDQTHCYNIFKTSINFLLNVVRNS